MNNDDLDIRALTDIWAFADLINFRGGQKNFYSLHKKMTDLNCRNQLETETKREYRRRIFLIPREHLKSTVNTVLYCLWRIYRNPDIRIIIGTNVKDLALDFIRECRAYLEDEDLIEEVWNNRPHISGSLIPRLTSRSSGYHRDSTQAKDTKVIWNNYALQVVRPLKDKQPTLEALSVGMRPTGSHCDLIVLDDIVDYDNSNSPKKAEKVKTWATDLESVVTKKSNKVEICPGFTEYVGNEILINGTRWFAWDYYSRFVGNSPEEQKERLETTKYSAMVMSVYVNGLNNSDGYICPELFDGEVEADLLTTGTLSPKVFAAQYLNRIISSEDVLFSKELVHKVVATDYIPREYSICNYLARAEIDPSSGAPRVFPFGCYMFIDLGSSSASGDKYALVVGGFDERKRLHIPEIRSGNWTPSIAIDKIYEVADKYNLASFWYEGGVGYQDSFRDRFLEEFDKPSRRPLVIHKHTPSRSVSKTTRIVQGLEPLMTAGRLYVSFLAMRHSAFVREVEFFDPNSSKNEDNILDAIEVVSRLAKPMPSYEERTNQNRGRHVIINTMWGGCR